jgi:tetratricopeptide (TPR) repeat protein
MTAMLVVVLGWPSLASAASRSASRATAPDGEREAEPPQTSEPNTEAEPPAPKVTPTPGPAATTPEVTLTPEGLARQQLEIRREQAALHWMEGEHLYLAGRYAEAAVEFERSYAAVPAADALYSAALSYERASKPVEAVRALERYLALPDCSDAPPEQRPIDCTAQRPLAERALAEQRRRVGELVLALGEGVELREVKVAGRTVPLEDFPLVLLPGTVDVEVFGLGPDEHRIRPASITGGEVTTLYVAPFEAEVAIPPDVAPPRGEPVDERRLERRQRGLKVAFWTGTGLTAASAVGLAVLGGLTLYHHRRFDEAYCGEGEDCEPSEHPYSVWHRYELAFERYEPATNAMVGVTVGLAVATALVGTFAFRKRAGEPANAHDEARVRLWGSGLVVRW